VDVVTAPREWRLGALGAFTFGALLASYAAFRPVRDALVLDGKPEELPWVFTATFVAMLVAAPIWGAAVGKRPRHVVPIAFHVFAACALVFFVLLRSELAPVLVGRVFYVWSAVFNLFVVSVFWSMLADLLGPNAGRRLYGPIAAGGTIGTFVGPLLTKLLLSTIGVAGVLVISALLLELAALGARQIRLIATRRGPSSEPDTDPPVAGGALSGLTQVARSRYLAAIVGYVLCTACAATFVYLAQARIATNLLPDRAARTDFFADIDLWVSAATFVVQLVIAAPLLGWLGPGIVLCVLPICQGIGIVTLVTAPSLAAVVIVQVIGRTATHGLTRPARELLFTVVDRADKYRAKNVIDTLAYRLGDVGSGWLDRGLGALGGSALVAFALPLALIWLALAGFLGAGFRRRVITAPQS
jgi:ATP:ADP antiporter, AAA family